MNFNRNEWSLNQKVRPLLNKSKSLTKFAVVFLAFVVLQSFTFKSEESTVNSVLEIVQNKKTVKGTITDSNGESVIGAGIRVKGGQAGTASDIDGNFSIAAEPGDILVISYVGYVTQEVKIGNETTINVVLKENAELLDEVVVVGFGVQKKVNLTGAVGVADSKILEDRPIANIAQGLQGALPNLNITFDSGSPTSGTTFNVRGSTSINGGNALILVDGIETNDISLLNPQDIENVSVLKDASSAAVYGARAAFGVILITTKSGKKGENIEVNYNNNFSWSQASRLPKGVASNVWLRAINQANINSGGGAYFSEEQIAATDAFISDPINNPSAFLDTTGAFTAKGQWGYAGNTDWFDVLYKTAFMQQHNASIRGGGEKNSYYASLGYKGQDGLLAFGDDDYSRMNMSFNFTTEVTKWLELGFRSKYNRSKSDEPYTDAYMGSSPYYEVYRAFPHIPVYLPNGDFAGVEGSNFNYNIAGMLDQAGRKKRTTDDVWFTGSFKITPFEGLSLQGDYTANKMFKDYSQHTKILYQSMPNVTDTPLAKGSPGGVYRQKVTDTYYATNIWANYTKTFKNDHIIDLMAGYNQELKKETYLETESSGLYLNDFPVTGLATTTKTSREYIGSWAVQGFFFRANYNYKSRYLLEANGRYDGSSKFPKGDRWGFFPSVSGAWRLSEEAFFEPARELFDNVKLRASYGSLGNQVVSDNFQYLSYLKGQSVNYLFGGKLGTGVTPPTLASTNITWEKVTTSNFGLDITMLRNRLNFSYDYYIRNTTDMVVSKTYPAVLGTSGGKENLASMRTNGWELSVSWDDRIENVGGSPLQYSFGFGVSDASSKITKFDNPTLALSNYYEGQKLGDIWGYVTDGFIQTQEEALEMSTVQKVISSTWIPGDIRYKDLDGDGVINYGDNTVNNPGDRKIIGNATPRYQFNIKAGASWKGFDLRLFFEGVGKRDVWLNSSVFWGYEGVWHSALNDEHINNSWTEDNRNAYFPVATFSSRSKQAQTKYLQDGSYIRLKDVTLSYTIPSKIVKKANLKQIRVFASGQNLWEASGLFKYISPDVVGKRSNNGNLDTDGKVYPFTRTYSFGFNVTF